MSFSLSLIALFIMFSVPTSCKKENKAANCFSGIQTVRQINNKRATVKLTATIQPVYLIGEGTIDARLIPCNLPTEFYQNDLQVTISGNVKATQQTASVPCCAENLVITNITR